ncbi:MAG: hypothetical protein OEX02_13540 [Cyclobacteriaceae bacterium]|nr:hypothetical protein [Cyclobacteriaceae bacterium]
MFEQYTADGTDVFITILACIFGFMAALGFFDFKKAQSTQSKDEN